MRRFAMLSSVFVVLLSIIGYLLFLPKQGQEQVGVISEVAGDVRVFDVSGKEWSGVKGTPLYASDRIQTLDGWVKMSFWGKLDNGQPMSDVSLPRCASFSPEKWVIIWPMTSCPLPRQEVLPPEVEAFLKQAP